MKFMQQQVTHYSAEQKIKGVYGPIIELFECEEQYMTAIEVAAGNAYVYSSLK